MAYSKGHVPIIALTAHAMKGDRERMLEAGMDDYVVGHFFRDVRAPLGRFHASVTQGALVVEDVPFHRRLPPDYSATEQASAHAA